MSRTAVSKAISTAAAGEGIPASHDAVSCADNRCGLRVLVVEDDPEVLEASLEALELLGHWATGVRSAEGALARFLEGAFDVVMADVGLPALSGLELADKLQARCSQPIIFATASQAPSTSLPGTVWLSKPFGIDQLSQALRQVGRPGQPAPDAAAAPGTIQRPEAGDQPRQCA